MTKKFIISTILLIILGILIPVMFQMFLPLLRNYYILTGVILFMVLYHTILHKKIGFLMTLDHEFSHTVFSIFTFHDVTELKATKSEGGYIITRSGKYSFGTTLIYLAPYFFRIPLVLITFMIWLLNKDTPEWYFLIAFGIGLSYHFCAIVHEAKPYQSDINQRSMGLFATYLLIIALNSFFLSLLATAMINDFHLLDYFTLLKLQCQNIWSIVTGVFF